MNNLTKVLNGKQLTKEQSKELFTAVAAGEVSDIELSGILLAMKTRGETAAEIAGIAEAFLAQANAFERPAIDFADIVGTGGDGANTFNISVTSALVASCLGANIIKHGNRGVSSKSGASDLLKAFGYPLELAAAKSRQMFDQFGFCFLFAPLYHPAFKHAATVRQQLKVRTLFNILGPLINPAQTKKILLGVYSADIMPMMAQSLQQQNYQHALIVHGDGVDEVNLAGTTKVAELKHNQIEYYSLTAADFGLQPHPLSAIQGGEPEYNKAIISDLLQGKGSLAQQHTVAANVALLLKLFGQDDLKQNAARVLELLSSGAVYQKLQQLLEFGRQLTDE